MKRLGANINGVAEELLGAHLTTEPTAGFVQGDGVPSADDDAAAAAREAEARAEMARQ